VDLKRPSDAAVLAVMTRERRVLQFMLLTQVFREI